MTNSSVHRTALALAGSTFLSLVAGGLVTSNQAGLAIPDWPLSYGTLLPAMHGGVVFQHVHRMLAAVTAALAAATLALVWKDRRKRVVRLALVACALVAAQVALGGIGVLLLLPRALSVLHATLAQVLCALTAALALFTSPCWEIPLRADGDRDWRPVPIPVVLLPAALVLLAALGAAYRHRGMGPVPHVLAAGATTALALAAAMGVIRRHPADSPLARAAKALTLLTLAQVFLGIGAYVAGIISGDAIPPGTVAALSTVSHLAVGALALAASVVLAIGVVRDATEPIPALPAAPRGQ